MGLWKALGRGLGWLFEQIGDITGVETISQFGRNIQDACAEKVGVEKSYKKEEANIYSTDRLNEILVSFSDGYYKQATTIENSCIRIVKDFYDNLIQTIEGIPEVSYNKANLNALKKGKAKISKSISGSIKDSLAKKMSLDDTECLKILKMDAGNEKTKAMSEFSQKVIAEALDTLSRKVRNSMNEQLEDIVDYLKNVSEEQERGLSKLKIQLEKMCVSDDLERGELEQYCIEPLLVIEAVDIVNDIIDGKKIKHTSRYVTSTYSLKNRDIIQDDI